MLSASAPHAHLAGTALEDSMIAIHREGTFSLGSFALGCGVGVLAALAAGGRRTPRRGRDAPAYGRARRPRRPQSPFDASSASALRSPFVSVMCPASFSFRNLFTTWMSPLLVESTYGLSIWYGSPVSTILVLSPTRVMIVFTSCGVRFCASSTMMNWLGMLRPRMYVKGSMATSPRSINSL